MKQENVIKALKKEGWEVNEYSHYFLGMNGDRKLSKRYVCANGKNRYDWYETDDLCSVQVMGMTERNDSQTDYFPGTWCRTIKMIISAMKW